MSEPRVQREPEKGDLDEPSDHALGRFRGDFSTKVHIQSDANGVPLNMKIMAAQEHKCLQSSPCSIAGKPGWPRKRAQNVVADKGYSSKAVRASIKKRGSIAIIAKRSNETAEYPFDKELYRNRNVVERQIGWLKESWSSGTRYEKLAVYFLELLTLGCIRCYLSLRNTTRVIYSRPAKGI